MNSYFITGMDLKIDTSTTTIFLYKRLLLHILVTHSVNTLKQMLTDSIFLMKESLISKKKKP